MFYFVDVDTRRRSACDLVQALSKSFEGPVIQNFSTYVQGLLEVLKIKARKTSLFIETKPMSILCNFTIICRYLDVCGMKRRFTNENWFCDR